MRAWLRPLFAPKTTAPIRKPAHTRLGVESLELREVMNSTFDPTSGVVNVVATEGHDWVEINRIPSSLGANFDSIEVKVNGRVELSVQANKFVSTWWGGYWTANVKNLSVDALGGNDTVLNNTSIASAIHGGAGIDTVSGGSGSDTIWGDWDTDYLHGGGGNDTIYAGRGNDTVWGDGGNDYIAGDEDDDTLYGGNDNDTVNGFDGNDTIYGGLGNDTLGGQNNNDVLFGEAGNDTLYGDANNDVLFGGAYADADTLYGGSGADLFLPIYLEDSPMDQAAEDARVQVTSNGVNFWSDAEVQQVARGMAFLMNQTGNTRLMKLSNGGAFEIQRVGYLGTNVLADNDSRGKIRFADWAFNPTVSVKADATIIHEIGHNWDTEMGSTAWGQWLGLSGWRPHAAGTPTPSGYLLSKDGEWEYSATADNSFARDYGRTSPMEDWCTMWEAYYAYKTGTLSATDTARLQTKLNFIDGFMAARRG